MNIEPCKKLIRDLDLDPGDEYTQDWTCEAADYRKLEMFLSYYYEETYLKSEEKRALIELILDSYESYVKIFDFNWKYSKKIKQILKEEYDLFIVSNGKIYSIEKAYDSIKRTVTPEQYKVIFHV